MMEFNDREVIETTSTTLGNSPQSNQREDKKNLATVDEIQDWLITYLSQLLEIEPNKISLTTSFDRYGFDSSATIGLTSDLGDWLGRSLDPGLTYDYPTIETLAEYLAE